MLSHVSAAETPREAEPSLPLACARRAHGAQGLLVLVRVVLREGGTRKGAGEVLSEKSVGAKGDTKTYWGPLCCLSHLGAIDPSVHSLCFQKSGK